MKLTKQNSFFILSSILLLIILTVTFVLLKIEWYFYVTGFILAIITHIIMLIQNKKLYNISKNEVERTSFHPKLSSLKWFFIKGIIIISITILLMLLTDIFNDPNAIRESFMYIGGYLTIKVMFIISLLIFKERG